MGRSNFMFMMRIRLLLWILAYVTSVLVDAQDPALPAGSKGGRPFAHVGLGGGMLFNPKSGQVGPDGTSGSLLKTISAAGTYVASSGWGGCFDYDHSRSTAEHLPLDYSCLALFGPCEPTDNLSTYSLRAVWEPRHEARALRLGLEAGPMIARLKETNFTPKPAGSNVAANYVTGQTTEIGPGLSMRARTLVPFGRVVGFEVGLFGNISGFQSLFGVDMALVFGVLRARRST
jgi:hypothetical protein